MKQKNLNQDLRMRIRNYLEHTHREFQETNSEHQKKVICKLSPSLQKEINTDIYKEFIFQNNLFNELFSPEFLKQTMDLVEEFVATPGEYLFKEGEQDDQSIYFVFEGKIEIKLNSQIIQIITGGKFDQQNKLEYKQKQDQITNENLKKKNINDLMSIESFSKVSSLFKREVTQKKRKKSIKMTNILNDKGKKNINSKQDCFFDLNRLAEEQSDKNQVSSKRQSIKDITYNFVEKIQNNPQYFGEYNFFCSQKERLYTAQAQEFSIIYKLKRAAFLQRIRDFKMDFEKFLEIQDEIFLFQHSVNFKASCISCGSNHHQHIQCNQIHVIPNKLNLIQNYNYTENQKRQYYDRLKVKSKNTFSLINQLIITEQKIQENYKNEIENILINIQQFCSENDISEDSDGIDNSNSVIQEDNIENIDMYEENINDEDINEVACQQQMILSAIKEDVEGYDLMRDSKKQKSISQTPEIVSPKHKSKRRLTYTQNKIKRDNVRKNTITNEMSEKISLLMHDHLDIHNNSHNNIFLINEMIRENQKILNSSEIENTQNQYTQNGKFSLSQQNTAGITRQNKKRFTINQSTQQQQQHQHLQQLQNHQQNKEKQKHIQPNVSNFVASIMNYRSDKPLSSLNNTIEMTDSNKNKIIKKKDTHSYNDLAQLSGEDVLKIKKSFQEFNFQYKQNSLLLNTDSMTQLPQIFKENSPNSKINQTTLENTPQKHNLYQFEQLFKEREKQKGQQQIPNQPQIQTNGIINQANNNNLLQQLTEHLVQTIVTQKGQNQERGEETQSYFFKDPSVYGNLTEISKNNQFGQFEKMKEFTFYFSHNNYSNVLFQLSYYQEKVLAMNNIKKQKQQKKKKNTNIDKVGASSKFQNITKSITMLAKGLRTPNMQKNVSDDGSFSSQISILNQNKNLMNVQQNRKSINTPSPRMSLYSPIMNIEQKQE